MHLRSTIRVMHSDYVVEAISKDGYEQAVSVTITVGDLKTGKWVACIH